MDFLHPSSWQGGFSGYYVPVESHSTLDEMETIDTSTKCVDDRTTSNKSFGQYFGNPERKMSIVWNPNKSISITQLTRTQHQRVERRNESEMKFQFHSGSPRGKMPFN